MKAERMAAYLWLGCLISLASIVFPAHCIPTPTATTEVAVQNITRISGYKFENLAVRANGQILATVASPVARIYQIDPFGHRDPIIVTDLPGVSMASGIKELEPDIFYVAGSNFSFRTLTSAPGTAHVFQLDMRGFLALPNGHIKLPAKVQEVASINNATLLNGMTAPQEANIVLIGDTFTGLVWRVNVKTGDVTIAAEEFTMKGPSKQSGGINGLKVWDGYLYYDNSGTSALFKLPISQNGSAMGNPVNITGELSCDDFIIDSKGTVFVAGPADIITRVSPNGQKSIIAGTINSNSSALVGPTAVAFGRTRIDASDLYVTTNGGVTYTVEGVTGVSRIDVAGLL